MRDFAEIAWFAIFVSTGILGLAVLSGILPLRGETSSLVDWIAAIGGWAGAAVAVPSLMILRGQSDTLRRQLSAASYPALQRRLEDVQMEMAKVDEIAGEIEQIRNTFAMFSFWTAHNVSDLYGKTEEIVHAIDSWATTGANTSRWLVRSYPNEALQEVRGAFFAALSADMGNARNIQRSMSRVQLVDAGRNEDAHIKTALNIAGHMDVALEMHDTRQRIAEWSDRLTGLANSAQRDIDRILGLH
jgi:hypothetical protein